MIKFWECWLSISPKYSVLPSHTKKKKKTTGSNTQNCNFASCAVQVRNLISYSEEHRLRVFENKVLIFEPKREENGLWRKLHN
jgi:hypothetical protein